MKTFAQLLALGLAGLLLLLAGLLGLGWQAGQARQAELQAQLDSHLLRQLQSSAENYLATGLSLEQMQAMQDIIEREQSAFASVVAIDVFSAAGTVLYSTDTDSRGQSAPAGWREQLAHRAPWTVLAPQQRTIGQRFDNDLGQPAGGIAVTLSTARPPPSLLQWRARVQQGLHWLLLAVLAAGATAGLLALGLHRLLAAYKNATRILQAGTTAPPPQDGANNDPLAQAARQQQQRWTARQRRIRQARAALEALDHE